MMVEMPLDKLEPQENLLVQDDEPSLAVGTKADPSTDPSAGEPCPHCHEPTFVKGAQWCSRCGFYPRLNVFVEPDPVVQTTTATAALSWYQEIPAWAWKLSAGLIVLAAIAFGCRLATPDEGYTRMICALTMLGLGVVAVVVAHGLAYTHAVFADAQTGIFDAVTRPIRVWLTTIRDFPQTFNRVAAASWGLAAIFLATAVIGGIPYSSLFDFGEPPPKQNLVKAITAQGFDAGEADGDLTGSIEDFAGQAAPKPEEEKQPEPPAKPDPRQKSVDCVIVGYIPRGEDDFDALVVATDVEGQLRVVALVSEGIPPEQRVELNQRLREIPRRTSFVPTSISADWVEPKLICSIRFRDWTSNKRLRSPTFGTRLADLP